MRIVIIGNGVAGIEAALTIRKQEPDWPITIISEESDHFFSRTALMWVLSGQMSYRDIEPYERDLYAAQQFERIRARVIDIDPSKKAVILAGSENRIAYDRLLIACGSRPRPAPWKNSELGGIGHFVTLQDLAWFAGELHEEGLHNGPPHPHAHVANSVRDSPYYPRIPAAKKRRRTSEAPAVVGGGLIGIEAVEVMLAMGLHPKFFVREEWFWPMAIDQRESSWIVDRMTEHGVDVHLQHDLIEFRGDQAGNVIKTCTNQGEYDTDMVVVAIGVVPHTDWLSGVGLNIDDRDGIVVDVDHGLQTSVPDVYAAGDCTSVRWFNGAVRPEQLWYTAREQGRTAGRAMLGQDASYTRGTWYNSAKLIDIEYTTVGLVNMNLAGETDWFFEESGPVKSTTRIVLQNERVVGFNLLGRRWDHTALIRWIDEERSLAYVREHLHEATFDTEFVPKLVIPASASQKA